MNRLFGLIGYPLGHSWSKKYFENKFESENITDASYQVFPIEKAVAIVGLLKTYPNLAGLNVTIPHKTSIITLLDSLDPVAREINAVNTIRIEHKVNQTILLGYNTDVHGFEQSIAPLLRPHHRSAMILGTGGAAKAAAWVFEKLGIDFVMVSRNPELNHQLGYHELSEDLFEKYTIIVNATPMGMAPDADTFPPLPYHFLSSHHLLFDMVYNPEETIFLKEGLKQGAITKNGFEMLQVQAEKAWEIWCR
ncbi:MAG: shikimate dehydrogenase [Bacteroidales bacterium]|nr:shikimate dehydrogenase [Bacteroidales bacterium]